MLERFSRAERGLRAPQERIPSSRHPYSRPLLLAMALGQALSFPSFATALEGYGVVPKRQLRPVAGVVIAVELLAGAGLLAGTDALHWPTAILAFVVAVGWTVVAALALYRRREVENCGCFGKYLTQPLRKSVLVQDAAFVGLAGWVILTCPV